MQLEESQLYCNQAAILVRLVEKGPWKEAGRRSQDACTQLCYPDLQQPIPSLCLSNPSCTLTVTITF